MAQNAIFICRTTEQLGSLPNPGAISSVDGIVLAERPASQYSGNCRSCNSIDLFSKRRVHPALF
jgi:hypothetical protein